MTLIITIFTTIFLFAFFFKLISNPTQSKEKINVEMIPFHMHRKNVRSRISPEHWRKVGDIVKQQSVVMEYIPKYRRKYPKNVCEQCGGDGITQKITTHRVECHEIWEFNDSTQTQKLIGLISLCPLCHMCKHIGRTEKETPEHYQKAINHIAHHNKWTIPQVHSYIDSEYEKIKQKNKIKYNLDLTYLNRNEFSFLQTKFTTTEQDNCRQI